MKRNYLCTLIFTLFIIVCYTIPSVHASWQYLTPPVDAQGELANKMGNFSYGTLYITNVRIADGEYKSAEAVKKSDLNISTDLSLVLERASSVVIEVTFYNNTEVSYYYNKTETVSFNNDAIGYTVSGIAPEGEIPSKTFQTVYVTFAYNDSDIVSGELLAELHFNFVVDKDSIGDVVAQTAIDRFRDILNNLAFETSYSTLITAMDNRSGFNKGSAVTYIGNVSGSSNSDSQVIESLFSEEFMSMDLDGDGNAEPITMMIKRENLDNDTSTGASYSYSSWGSTNTVYGVEMTIYITSENLDNVSNGKSIVVYAATFTKLAGSDTWTELVPLTKGVANANNYSGYGSANSFNTDTWVSDSGKTMKELASDL